MTVTTLLGCHSGKVQMLLVFDTVIRISYS